MFGTAEVGFRKRLKPAPLSHNLPIRESNNVNDSALAYRDVSTFLNSRKNIYSATPLTTPIQISFYECGFWRDHHGGYLYEPRHCP